MRNTRYRPLTERFWEKVIKGDDPDDCWGWSGSAPRYAELGAERGMLPPGRTVRAHRVSWEIHFGPIPPGMEVLHHCDNPPCSNPRCLFLGTQTENLADMRAKGRGGAPGRKAVNA